MSRLARTCLAAALMLFVFSGCTAARYSEERRFMSHDDYEIAQGKLLAQAPLDAQGWAMLAECRFYLKDYPGMADACRKSLAISDEQQQTVAFYLQEAYVVQLKEALHAFESGKELDASKLLNEVLVFGNEIPPEISPRIVQTNKSVAAIAAAAAIKLRDYPQARTYLEGLRDQWKDNPDLMERLAFTYYQMGEDSLCVGLCEQILKSRPSDEDALMLRVQALRGRTQRQDALNAYRDALQVSAQEPVLRRNLGILLFELGEFKPAALQLETACQDTNADSWSLLVMIAECAFHDGEFNRALDYYKRALHIQPENRSLLQAIGACYWSLGQKSEAEAAFAKAGRPALVDSSRASLDSTASGHLPADEQGGVNGK
jgi:tetratricopeptide (TPR) repeat protein